MAPEDLPILAGTTPKPGFLDSHEPRNHTGEKREGRGERGEEKRTAGTHNFYIAYFGRQKSARDTPLGHLNRAVPFSKIRVYIYIYIYIYMQVKSFDFVYKIDAENYLQENSSSLNIKQNENEMNLLLRSCSTVYRLTISLNQLNMFCCCCFLFCFVLFMSIILLGSTVSPPVTTRPPIVTPARKKNVLIWLQRVTVSRTIK